MNWQVDGKPSKRVWCLLEVRELKNAFGWTGPIVGMWDGTEWMIRTYLPEMQGGSFKILPAGENLEVIMWQMLNRPTKEEILHGLTRTQ